MSVLADLGDYVTTGSIGFTTGTNLFLGKLPPTPITAAAIYETGGAGTVHTFSTGPGNAVLERPRVQVVVRSSGGYTDARSKMASLFSRLDGTRNVTINSVRYQWIASVQSPFFLKFDANEFPVLAVNFDVMKGLS